MSLREPIKVLADVLTSELSIPSGRIMVSNQNYDITHLTTGLFVMLGYSTTKCIGNNNYWLPTVSGLTEVQEVLMLYTIDIEIMSYDDSARQQKEAVFMALRSQAAEYAMNQYLMQFARIPQEFHDLSELEEDQMLTRYVIPINVTALTQNIKAIADYETFSQPQVTANQ